MTSDKTGFVFCHVIFYLATDWFGNDARVFKMSQLLKRWVQIKVQIMNINQSVCA